MNTYQLGETHLDLGQEVQIRNIFLIKDQELRCILDIFNYSPKTISSIFVTVSFLTNEKQFLLAPSEFKIDGLAIPPKSTLEVNRLSLPSSFNQVNQLNVYINQVMFTDGTIKHYHKHPRILPLERISKDEDLISLRSVAGRDCKIYPKDFDEIWRCICSTFNHMERKECICCHRSKDLIFKQFLDKNMVSQRILTLQNSMDEKFEKLKQESRPKNNYSQIVNNDNKNIQNSNSKKKPFSKKKIALISAAILIIISSLFLYFLLSGSKFKDEITKADDLINNDNYQEALLLYEGILNKHYDEIIAQKRDEVKLLIESKENYEKGIENFEDEDYSSALEYLNKVSSKDKKRYDDAREKIKEIKKEVIKKANQKIKSKDYEEALSIIEEYLDAEPDDSEILDLKEEILNKNNSNSKNNNSSKDDSNSLEEKPDDSNKLSNAQTMAANLIGSSKTLSNDASLMSDASSSASSISTISAGTECNITNTKVESSGAIWCKINGTDSEGLDFEGWIPYSNLE